MPRVNELGDIEITDAETMHALAEPGRLVAYRVLGREMFRRVDELPRRWLSETEPELEPQWRAVSGFVSQVRATFGSFAF